MFSIPSDELDAAGIDASLSRFRLVSLVASLEKKSEGSLRTVWNSVLRVDELCRDAEVSLEALSSTESSLSLGRFELKGSNPNGSSKASR